jgi:hypothetical protein
MEETYGLPHCFLSIVHGVLRNESRADYEHLLAPEKHRLAWQVEVHCLTVMTEQVFTTCLRLTVRLMQNGIHRTKTIKKRGLCSSRPGKSLSCRYADNLPESLLESN